MRSITKTIWTMALFLSAFQAQASAQKFTVVPAQPAAGENFQLVVPVDGCGLHSVTGSVQPGSFDIYVDIKYLPDVFCTAVVREPEQVNVKVFRENNVAQEGVYRVTLSHSVLNSQAPARASGYGLISVLRKDAAGFTSEASAESGAWMQDPGYTGGEDFLPATLGPLNSQRVHIEQRGQQISLQLTTFDLAGRAIWLQSSGVRQGNVFNGDLLQVVGRSPFDTTLEKKPEYTIDFGQVSIEFISPARALVWLSQASGEQAFKPVPLVIVRQVTEAEARTALKGRWVLSLEDDDNSVSAMRAEVLNLSPSADQNELYVDSAKMYALRCFAAPSPVALAPSCDLIRFGQFVDAKFNQVGLNRLRGTNAAGKKVSLFRVTD